MRSAIEDTINGKWNTRYVYKKYVELIQVLGGQYKIQQVTKANLFLNTLLTILDKHFIPLMKGHLFLVLFSEKKTASVTTKYKCLTVPNERNFFVPTF